MKNIQFLRPIYQWGEIGKRKGSYDEQTLYRNRNFETEARFGRQDLSLRFSWKSRVRFEYAGNGSLDHS